MAQTLTRATGSVEKLIKVEAPLGTTENTFIDSPSANTFTVATGDGTTRLTINSTAVVATTPIGGTGSTVTDIGTLAAAGTTIADAGVIANRHTLVTAADATKGVVLPAANVGDVYVIGNGAAAVLKVYPAVDSSINGLAANANIAIAASKGAVLVKYNATAWMASYG